MTKVQEYRDEDATEQAGTGGRRVRVAERAVSDIEKYIKANGLRPGDKIPPERVLVDLFGVGRSSLREALRILSTAGIVTVRHGDGMYVAAAGRGDSAVFDATEQNALRNLVETRQGTEVAAVGAAAARASEDDLAQIRRMLDEQESSMRKDGRFVWQPMAFELAVVEASGNSWLFDIELMLRDAWEQLSSGIRASVGRHAEWHAEHRAILASLKSRNAAQAQRLVIAHLSLERFEEDLELARTNALKDSLR